MSDVATIPATRRTPVAWDPALLAVIGLALLARVIVAILGPQEVLSSTWEYEDVARNLFGGAGFTGSYDGTPYRALVHPAYPALCVAVYWLVGQSSLSAMQVVQSLAVIPMGWFAFSLGSTLGGRRAGILAALGVTLHPALMIFSVRRHALWLDAFVFLGLLWVTYCARRYTGTSRLVTVGALFGVGLLCRSSTAVFMVFACGWLAWQWRTSLTMSLRRTALIVGTASLIAAPWLIRNAIVLDRPTGFVSTTSYGLWIGNNPDATGGALMADGTAMAYADSKRVWNMIQGRSEMEQQDIYRSEALAFIANHPGTAALNYFRKLRIFLFWSAHTGAWYPAWFNAAYRAFYLVLLACAIIGAIRLVRSGNGAALLLCVGFVMSIGLLQSIFFVEGRHRWEVESALVILAACGVGMTRPDKEGMA
jgi:hypothetical protein